MVSQSCNMPSNVWRAFSQECQFWDSQNLKRDLRMIKSTWNPVLGDKPGWHPFLPAFFFLLVSLSGLMLLWGTLRLANRKMKCQICRTLRKEGFQTWAQHPNPPACNVVVASRYSVHFDTLPERQRYLSSPLPFCGAIDAGRNSCSFDSMKTM